ncbi:peptidase M15 [Epidermidibacterium keratini]|uniref:Peptidase M15 n=1 Tax=Epidermidibacterium keratini TaxID=1891644 RepID=A0A7L4YQV8_9ACTN|nr:M15 family metallopeptidase [Epidermidibacterium keratini]QHC01621.1 peptidase M15 [Epidermidibacterium keratini]
MNVTSFVPHARNLAARVILVLLATLATVAGCAQLKSMTSRDPHAGGDLPAGVTVFDDRYPAITKLDSSLLDALRESASEGADHGVEFVVNSGWRSPEFQQQLFDEAVATYGSAAQASQWVAPPTSSAHVTGDAVDIGGHDAQAWLSEYGPAYGLCQIYDNEPWHFELRPDAADTGCPATYADAAHRS